MRCENIPLPLRLRRVAAVALALLAAAAFAASAATGDVDRQPPIIVVLQSESAAEDGDLVLRARIDDASGIESATVWVRGEHDAEFRPFGMIPGGQFRFSATLPAWPGRGSRVTYYVEATDGLDNGPRRSGSPRTPFVAKLEPATAGEDPASEAEGGGWLGTLLIVASLPLGLVGWRLARKRGDSKFPPLAREPGTPDIPEASLEALWSDEVPHPDSPAAHRGGGGASAGTSLIETLIVLAVLGIALGMSVASLDAFEAPVKRGSEMLVGGFRQARASAMATTTAHRIRPLTDRLLVVESAPSCASGSWTMDRRLDVELPDLVMLDNTDWQVCFDTRGTASENRVLTLRHPRYKARTVEVLRGGAARTVP